MALVNARSLGDKVLMHSARWFASRCNKLAGKLRPSAVIPSNWRSGVEAAMERLVGDAGPALQAAE